MERKVTLLGAEAEPVLGAGFEPVLMDVAEPLHGLEMGATRKIVRRVDGPGAVERKPALMYKKELASLDGEFDLVTGLSSLSSQT